MSIVCYTMPPIHVVYKVVYTSCHVKSGLWTESST